MSLDLPWKNEKQKLLDRALYIDITDKITNIFEKIKDINNNKYLHLFEYIKREEISCITLNYDLLLEKKLSEISLKKIKSYEDYYNIPIINIIKRSNNYSSGLSDYEDEEKFNKILKLHGSINWLWSGINSNDTIYCDTIKKEYDKVLIQDLTRYIIPPISNKTYFYNGNLLHTIWKQAYNEIRNACEIYIIGFSFPETDVAIKYLFQSALSKNNNIRKIYVINTDITLKEKYNNIFNTDILDFTYCCNKALDKFVLKKISKEFL